MPEESKVVDPKTDVEAAKDVLNGATDEDSGEEAEPTDSKDPDSVAVGSTTKKKKSKKAKLKNAFRVGNKEDGDKDASASSSNPASKLTGEMVDQLLEMNPSLKSEVEGLDKGEAAEKLKKLDVADLLTGMEPKKIEEGPIKIIDPETISKEPSKMLEGFEWVTMDLTNDNELEEVYDLLTGHYVEDGEAMFRFNYSPSFLNW
ncbi:hypothetical protein P7C71_g4829, partial [Lecanoromycetidae sp. Uapishka_2]